MSAGRLVGGSMDLVPLLALPAVSPDDTDDADHNDDNAPATAGGNSKPVTLLDELSHVYQQCSVFKKSANELAAGDAEDVQVIAGTVQ